MLQRALDEQLPFGVGFDDILHRLALEQAREALAELPAAVRPANLEMTARICVTVLGAVTRMASVQYPVYLDCGDFVDVVTALLWRFVYRKDQSKRRRSSAGA